VSDYNLGTARGKIKLDYEGKGVRQAKDDIEDLERHTRPLVKIAEAATGMLQKMMTAIQEGASEAAKNAGTALTNLGTNIFNLIIPSIAMVELLTSAFALLAPVIYLVVGAAGALVTALVGAIGAFAVLKIGLSGLSDAFGEVMENGKATEKTLKNLSPNARKLVHEFERLAPALKSLRSFVQDKLLEGMSGQIRALAEKWLPALRPILGGLAKSFNGLAKQIFTALGKPAFIKNIAAAMSGFDGVIVRIGQAVGPLIDAFGRIAKAAVPVLRTIVDWIAGIIEQFSAWIKQADATGALDSFFARAAVVTRQILDIVKQLLLFFGLLIQTLFPSSDKLGSSAIDKVLSALQKVNDWLSKPENQEKVRAWVDKIISAVNTVVTMIIPAVASIVSTVAGWVAAADRAKDRIVSAWNTTRGAISIAVNGILGTINALASIAGRVAGFFNDMKNRAVAKLTDLVNTVKGLPGRIVSALGNLGSLLLNAGRQIIQGLIDGIAGMIGSLKDKLSSITSLIPSWKGPITVDVLLLTSNGKAIMQGLIDGIVAMVPSLRKALGGITASIGSMPLDNSALVRSAMTGLTGTANGVTANAVGPATTTNSQINNVTVNVPSQITDPNQIATFTIKKINTSLGTFASASTLR
jgi:phage-related protein